MRHMSSTAIDAGGAINGMRGIMLASMIRPGRFLSSGMNCSTKSHYWDCPLIKTPESFLRMRTMPENQKIAISYSMLKIMKNACMDTISRNARIRLIVHRS